MNCSRCQNQDPNCTVCRHIPPVYQIPKQRTPKSGLCFNRVRNRWMLTYYKDGLPYQKFLPPGITEADAIACKTEYYEDLLAAGATERGYPAGVKRPRQSVNKTLMNDIRDLVSVIRGNPDVEEFLKNHPEIA